jgi:hypothetical protein
LATITTTPVASIVNIVAGTHSLLCGAFFGGGGVYRERLLFERGISLLGQRGSVPGNQAGSARGVG